MNSRWMRTALIAVLLTGLTGCGTAPKERKDQTFATSGSPKADQRAEQRMARTREMRGQSAEAQEKQEQKALEGKPGPATEAKKTPPTLYERLGGDQGLRAIVDDFAARAVNDPRVNFSREGMHTTWRDKLFGNAKLSDGGPAKWQESPENVARFKEHMVQFLAVATGGPPRYDGREIKDVHHGMAITNAEFDATIGDLKATLDKLGVGPTEQKELLAIMETTRPQIVEKK